MILRAIFVCAIVAATTLAQQVHPVRSSSADRTLASIAPQHRAILIGVNRDMNTYVPPPPRTGPANATFIVTYNGFPAQAQVAFQYAVDIWAGLISSSVPIRVNATWSSLPPGVLGSAGATGLYRDFPNAPRPNTWYAVAVAEKLAGVDLNGTSNPDINANFSSSFSNWYFGTDGNTPPGQYDFVSVVLHELGHGLSFFGSMDVSGGQGSWGSGTPYPFIYDRYAENGAGQSLLNTTLFPNPSAALAAQLQSNNLFFNGPEAVAANGGIRPRLYAPATWASGSSYSHLDEATYPAGSPNSLMTPLIGTAEAIHNPGPITLGMFRDMGWTTTAGGGTFIKFEERFTSTVIPPGWRVVDRDGGGVPLAFRQLVVFQSGDTVRPQTGVSFWFGSFNGANSQGRIDEWLIGPRINNIVAGDSLYFYAGAIGGQFPDSLRVFISTTDSNVTSFTNQIGYFRVPGPIGSWHQFGFDLTPFAGSHIFFAVNYYIVDGGPSGTNSDNVWVDHFIITTDNPTSVQQPSAELPTSLALHQNYPNPFSARGGSASGGNPTTQITYALPKESFVTLKVFNLLGQEVATLVNQHQNAGHLIATWDGRSTTGQSVGSGVYFYRLEARPTDGSAPLISSRKMIVVR